MDVAFPCAFDRVIAANGHRYVVLDETALVCLECCIDEHPESGEGMDPLSLLASA